MPIVSTAIVAGQNAGKIGAALGSLFGGSRKRSACYTINPKDVPEPALSIRIRPHWRDVFRHAFGAAERDRIMSTITDEDLLRLHANEWLPVCLGIEGEPSQYEINGPKGRGIRKATLDIVVDKLRTGKIKIAGVKRGNRGGDLPNPIAGVSTSGVSPAGVFGVGGQTTTLLLLGGLGIAGFILARR